MLIAWTKWTLLENLCAIDLHSRYPGEKALWYWNRNVEVDFYLPEENTGIQACYSTSKDIETFKRETDALLALDKVPPLDRRIIVTYDEERVFTAAIYLHNSRTDAIFVINRRKM